MIQDHAEQAGGKRNHNQREQQPSFCTQFLSVRNGMDDAKKQKKNGRKFMDMYTGQRYHDGDKEADKQCDVKYFLHADIASAAGMVLTPQMK